MVPCLFCIYTDSNVDELNLVSSVGVGGGGASCIDLWFLESLIHLTTFTRASLLDTCMAASLLGLHNILISSVSYTQ